MAYLPDATIALFRRSLNLGIYFHLATDPPLAYWAGASDIEQEVELGDVTLGSQLYLATRLGEVPDFEVMLNGGAERGEFTLEGVSAQSMDEIAGLDPPVLGKELYIGIAAHDDAWQPATPILPLATAIADLWSMARTRVVGSETPRQTISLSVGFGETGRSRPRRAIYSNSSQQLLYSGDTFCIDVPRYHRGYVIAWPRF